MHRLLLLLLASLADMADAGMPGTVTAHGASLGTQGTAHGASLGTQGTPSATATTPETYMALVPRNIRPNTVLTIPVQFLKPVRGQTVHAKLIDVQENVTVAEARGTAANGAHAMAVELTVPRNVSWGSYRVNLTGTGSVPFENSTTVYGRQKAISIYIQTDKATYKPGETVKYRVFVTNGALQLVAPTLNIEIFDPKGNKIDERTGFTGLMGMEGELPLSDMPPLGRWKISAEAPVYARGAQTDLSFQVEEYVLPKFEVTVSLPSFATISDPSVSGTVKARYTFGKPVDGQVVITISKQYSSGFFDVRAIRLEKTLSGEVAFDIPMDAFKRLSRGLDYQSFVVHANVTETVTGITLDGQASIRFHEQPYKLEFFPNMPSNFRPGFGPYNVRLRLTQQDGRPVTIVSGQHIDVTVSYFTDKPVLGRVANTVNLAEFETISPFLMGDTILKNPVSYPIQPDGTVFFTLDLPDNTATATIKAQYAEETQYKEIRRFRSPGEVYLQAKLLNTNPLKIGDTATIKLTSSEGPLKAHYVVISKGEIAAHGEIHISGGRNKEGSASLPITRAMTPSARMVAYFIRSDGEVVADGINFVIDDIFENKVSIEFNTTTARPKDNVTFTVRADENSKVNILAVDKSVLLLRQGNDITPDRVTNELRQYGDVPWLPWTRGWGPVMPWSFSADDATDVFDNAQIEVLTNANLHRFDLWRLNQQRFTAMARGTSGGAGFGGRMAFSAENDVAAVGAAPPAPGGEIRKDFPETWMFDSDLISNGAANFERRVPDTITDFVANAFALHPVTGLGVATEKANLTVFKPFFLNLQLPYSVVRGEIAILQATVFNYLPNDIYVQVRLAGSPEFSAVKIDSSGNELDVDGDHTKCVQVKANQPMAVFFSVRPKTIGSLVLDVKATPSSNPARADTVIRNLPVKAEGEEKFENIPVLITMQQSGTQTETRTLTYPANVVAQSQRVRVTAIGDILGPSLENLDTLIMIPYGCGEQNMLRFAPAVFAAEYMKTTGRFDNNRDLQSKIRNAFRTGYQRELIYQRDDGSFSAFGAADDSGSLWLTAFVAKSFAQASSLNLIYIDRNVVDRAVQYILENQLRNGRFNNTGIVNHKALQGQSTSSQRVLTAYVIIALKEVDQAGIVNPVTMQNVSSALGLAESYLAESYLRREESLMTSDYERAIGAYALSLMGQSAATALLGRLETSPNRTMDGYKVYWKNDNSRALEIETAAYALMAYSTVNNTLKGFNVMYWLVEQRGPFGGYSSTQDTVVALQAVSLFAAGVYSKDVNLDLTISTTTAGVTGTPQTKRLTSTNHDVLQIVDFPENVDNVTVQATGTGLALIDINQFYNVLTGPVQPKYELRATTSKESKNKYTLRVCARFLERDVSSNMAILDMGFISGFEPEVDKVVKHPLVKRVEMAGGRFVIYFDEIPSSEVCVQVPVQRVTLVSGVKPANVIAYSYYEPSERAMVSYMPTSLQTSRLCDTCGAKCGCSTTSTETPLVSTCRGWGRVRRPITKPGDRENQRTRRPPVHRRPQIKRPTQKPHLPGRPNSRKPPHRVRVPPHRPPKRPTHRIQKPRPSRTKLPSHRTRTKIPSHRTSGRRPSGHKPTKTGKSSKRKNEARQMQGSFLSLILMASLVYVII